MEDFLGGTNQATQPGRSGTIALFLALYLLILAFFILLVSISSVEEVKSKAVMDSLSSTFTSLLPPTSDLTVFTTKDEGLIAGQEFQEQVTGIFSAALQVARVEVVQPGREMRVTVSANTLFHVGEARIREAQFPLLDRIVAAVSGRPPGLRYDLEFVIDTPYAVGQGMPIGQTLEMARAGAFGRAMASRGIPPDSLVVGMKPGKSKDVVIWFHVRSMDQAKVDFLSPKAEDEPANQAGSTGNTGTTNPAELSAPSGSTSSQSRPQSVEPGSRAAGRPLLLVPPGTPPGDGAGPQNSP